MRKRKKASKKAQKIASKKRFISMLSDYGFKIAFANEADTTFLRRAIQALIKSKTPIKSVVFERNEITPSSEVSRGGLFDVTCKDENGITYIIEMQVLQLTYFIHRAKFYGFHRYNRMVKKGDYKFDDLTKIYVISILAGTVYPKVSGYHQISCLRNQRGQILDDQITHVTIELGKWNKTIKEVQESNKDIDKLLYVMKATDKLTIDQSFEPVGLWDEDWLKNTIKELELHKMTPEQREIAERRILQHTQVMLYHQAQTEKYAKEYAAKIELEKLKAEQKAAKSEQAKIKAEQELEQEKIKAKRKLEQEKIKAERKLEQEKIKAKQKLEQEKIKTKQKLEQERIKAEQETTKKLATEKRNGHKLLIKSLLNLNIPVQQIADSQNWSVAYVEELKKDIN